MRFLLRRFASLLMSTKQKCNACEGLIDGGFLLETLLDGSTFVFCLPCIAEAREAFYADQYHAVKIRNEPGR